MPHSTKLQTEKMELG